MRNCILFMLIVSMVAGCNVTDETFVNHDKWLIEIYSSRNPLKHQPTEVIDSIFINLNDSTLHATGFCNTVEKYHFDKEGNIVSRTVIIDSVGRYDMTYEYDEEGRHHYFRSYDLQGKLLSGAVQGISKKMDAGGYKVTELVDGKPGSAEKHWTFENGGSKVTEERFVNKNITIASTYEYDGDRLMSEKRKVDDRSNFMYHYSAKGFLDSVVTTADGGTGSYQVVKFINNEYGDPVFQAEILNGHTNYTRRIKYEYDEIGNWIKRLVHETGIPNNYMSWGKNPEYTLTNRHIKY